MWEQMEDQPVVEKKRQKRADGSGLDVSFVLDMGDYEEGLALKGSQYLASKGRRKRYVVVFLMALWNAKARLARLPTTQEIYEAIDGIGR